MKKRVWALVLAASMVTGSLAACGGGSGSGASSSGQSADGQTTAGQNAAGTTAAGESKTEEPAEGSGEVVKLTGLYVSHNLTKSMEDMQYLQEWEKECGVEIEWEQIYTDWPTTKPTRFASGDIPDIMINATADSDYTQYEGLFLELTDLIENHAPNIKAMFEEVPDTKVLAQTKEGKIYGLSKFQGKWPSTASTMFINKEWLDKLGLEVPTTFSELEQVLLAFKEQDPNGNGLADEIPMDWYIYNPMGFMEGQSSAILMLGSMGIQRTDQSQGAYFAEAGEIKNFAVDERYKLFIKYLNRLYEQGLINQNVTTTTEYQPYQSLGRGNENGDALVGFTFGWEATDRFGPDLYKQYVSVPALEYDIDVPAGTYDKKWCNDYNILNLTANRAVISAKCKNPEAAIKFLDGLYDQTRSVEVLFGGIADGCVEKVSDTHFKVLAPLDADTDPGTWKWTNSMADWGPMYIRDNVQIDMQFDMENALTEREVYEADLAKVPDTDLYPRDFMKYTTEEQNALAMNQANINNIIDNYWAMWVTGESDIDADWDTYVENVKNAGLEENLKLRQAAYDAYMAGKK